MYPDNISRLKIWQARKPMDAEASAVTLIIPARKENFSDILQIADILLLDKDDLVQKGMGGC